MTRQHIVLLYSPAGGGHRAAASAIEDSLRILAPDAVVENRNILDFAPAWFRYDRAWALVQKHGVAAWDWLFDYTDNQRSEMIDEARLPLHRVLFRELDEYLVKTQPTHVVATHYLPAIAVARLRRTGALRAHALTVVTDHSTHRAWATEGIDGYCVADPSVARAMSRRDPQAPAVVTGIPVSRDASAPVRALQTHIDVPRILLLLFGVPADDGEATVASLAPLVRESRAHLHVLCGTSDGMLDIARRHLAGSNAVIEERAPSLLPRFDAADVVVTKAGGLSVSECLARGRPLLLPFAAPGQERGNLFYALDAGAAARPLEPADTGQLIAELAADPGRLRRMGFRARLASRPLAADAVARYLLTGAAFAAEVKHAA